ncbi:MAG: T9SS type A sorting domain-containing protein [Aureispira sp.]|nr:T9SS type A sorting domain-containing protein [Aureispira sp.]
MNIKILNLFFLLFRCVCPAITNDDPCNAINIPVNPDLSCTAFVSAHTAGATQSSAGCTGTADDDVWFSFVATSTDHNIDLSNIRALTGTSTDMVFEVFSGSCGSLTSVICSDPNSTALTGLTVGNTYFIRVYSYGTTSTDAFDICITTPIPPPPCGSNPAPTDICTAAPLINNLNGFCGTTAATYNATSHGNVSSVFCGSIENNSFFQFQATGPTVSINYWISGASCTSGIQIEIFTVTGACATGTWTSVSTCLSPSGAAGTSGNYVMSGLVAGTTYYVMIDGFGGDVCDYVFQADLGILLNVELISFTGFAQDNSNKLLWSTVQEQNTKWHVVERSYDGVNFDEIGRVEAIGTSNKQVDYGFEDGHPLRKGYYRIRTILADGEESLSQIISIERKKQDVPLINVFPIPTDNELVIQYDSPRKEDLSIKLTNMVGALVKEQTLVLDEGLNTIPVSLEHLPKGVYILHIYNSVDQRVLKKKIIKN